MTVQVCPPKIKVSVSNATEMLKSVITLHPFRQQKSAGNFYRISGAGTNTTVWRGSSYFS